MYFKIKSEAQEALKKAVDQFDCDFEDEINKFIKDKEVIDRKNRTS